MRKAIGAAVRKRLFGRIRDLLPQFQRVGQSSGVLWRFRRKIDDSFFTWLGYQQHHYWDAFTIDVGWSKTAERPLPTLVEGEEGVLRLGLLLEPPTDYWWWVGPPLPEPPRGIGFDQHLFSLVGPDPHVPMPAPVDEVLRFVAMSVDDAVERILQIGLPYLERANSERRDEETWLQTPFAELSSAQLLLLGKTVVRRHAPADLAAWAADLVDLAQSYTPNPNLMKKLSCAARDRDAWHEGRSLFEAIRRHVLAIERSGSDDHPAAEPALLLGENVAKMLYNFSGGSAPYDADAPDWIPVCVRDVVTYVEEPDRENLIETCLRLIRNA